MKHILILLFVALSSFSLTAQTAQELTEMGKKHYDNQNYSEALPLLQKAAEQNSAAAQYLLGRMYYNGDGVEQNDSISAYWMEKAANLNNSDAQGNLGLYHIYGVGVEQNYDKAIHWLTIAADEGDQVASYYLGQIYGNFAEFDDIVPIDYAKALKYMQLSVDNGNILANRYLGMIYADGLGVTPDREKALQYFRLAAEVDDPISIQFLVETTDDPKEAFQWELKGANDGNVMLMTLVGGSYFMGLGTERDPLEGLSWLALAAEIGESNAQRFLGNIYLGGYFLEKNLKKAKEWLTLSAQNGNENAAEDLKKLDTDNPN